MTDEDTTAKFLRGLTIGAILGAIIAGSRLWRLIARRSPWYDDLPDDRRAHDRS
jgi:hypothetical protein